MTWGPAYHVGYVVPELERAMDEVGSTLGLTWTAIGERTRTVHTLTGVIEMEFCVVYSLEGPPYVELIQQVAGTPWSGDPSALHHVGHWSQEVRRDSDLLAGAGIGYVAHADGAAGGETWRWAYHHHPAGGYLEIVDQQVAADLESRFEAAREAQAGR